MKKITVCSPYCKDSECVVEGIFYYIYSLYFSCSPIFFKSTESFVDIYRYGSEFLCMICAHAYKIVVKMANWRVGFYLIHTNVNNIRLKATYCTSKV